MASAPVLKRFYKGQCARCGRPLDKRCLPDTRLLKVLVGCLSEELWCRRCATTSRRRGLLAWANSLGRSTGRFLSRSEEAADGVNPAAASSPTDPVG